LLIVSVWILLVIGLGPDFGLGGDDVLILSQPLREAFLKNAVGSPYISMMQGRGYLLLAYVKIYEHLNYSAIAMQWLFLSLLLINGILFFILLRHFYNVWIALICAIFFMFYANKAEFIVAPSGGLYHLVLGFLLICLIILYETNWSWKNKFFLISFFYWLSLHLYEILILVSPLVPLYFAYITRNDRTSRTLSNWLISFLPIGLGGIHIYLLASSAGPIWNRSGHVTYPGILQRIPEIFYFNLDALLGFRHWEIVKIFVPGFFSLVEKDEYRLVIFFTAALCVVIIIVTLVTILASRLKVELINSKKKTFIFFGFYLLLISGLISFPVAKEFTPERLTYLPSLGLSIILGQIISLRFFGQGILIGIFGLWTLIEGVSLRMTLFNASEIAQFDNQILKQLSSYNIQPNLGDTIFISTSPRKLEQVFINQPARFEGGNAQPLLLLLYQDLLRNGMKTPIPFHKMINYSTNIRRPPFLNDDPSFLNILKPLAYESGRLYAFNYNTNNQLCEINSLITKEEGQVIWKNNFKNLLLEKNQCRINIYIPREIEKKVQSNYPSNFLSGIDFTRQGYPNFIREVSGVADWEPLGRWTVLDESRKNSNKAILKFYPNLPERFKLEITANAFGPNSFYPTLVTIGNQTKQIVISEKYGQTYSLFYEGDGGKNIIKIEPPQPISPLEMNLSPDQRKIGVRLISIKIYEY